MSGRYTHGVVLTAVVAVVQLAGFRAGAADRPDKVVVLEQADVMMGAKVVATVKPGDVLIRLKRTGDWVGVALRKDGQEIKGWVHWKKLAPYIPPEPVKPKPDSKPDTKPDPDDPVKPDRHEDTDGGPDKPDKPDKLDRPDDMPEGDKPDPGDGKNDAPPVPAAKRGLAEPADGAEPFAMSVYSVQYAMVRYRSSMFLKGRSVTGFTPAGAAPKDAVAVTVRLTASKKHTFEKNRPETLLPGTPVLQSTELGKLESKYVEVLFEEKPLNPMDWKAALVNSGPQPPQHSVASPRGAVLERGRRFDVIFVYVSPKEAPIQKGTKMTLMLKGFEPVVFSVPDLQDGVPLRAAGKNGVGGKDGE